MKRTEEECVMCQGGVADDIETELCGDCYLTVVFELNERRGY